MTQTAKTDETIDVTTRAAIAIMKRNGKPIPGPDLFPRILSRAAQLVDEENDGAYEDTEVVAPNERFLRNHWKDIKILAAGKYETYIIPSKDGFYLGTGEEYAQITEKWDMPIEKGIRRSGLRRARILRGRGIEALVIEEIKVTPLLESGDIESVSPG